MAMKIGADPRRVGEWPWGAIFPLVVDFCGVIREQRVGIVADC